MNSPELRKTALNAIHRQSGARMIEFAGWEMPVQYSGPIQEHMAVRTGAGIFDVSHMGEVELKGPAAEENLQRLTCNDVNRLAVGQCQYSALTTPQGTFIDDVLVYCLSRSHFLMCVNASNQEKDYKWVLENTRGQVDALDRSEDFSQLAVQGPAACSILQPLTELRLSDMKSYWFVQGKMCDAEVLISRTGYTGEDGFEIYCHPAHGESLWTRIMESGKAAGIQPAGLAARNTLRLEAKLALYGNDIDDTTTVLEADLGWICKLDKGDFIGRDVLIRQKQEGLKRKLVGFEMAERGIARDHYRVEISGQSVGTVTSGSPAPFLKKNIGLTYLPADRWAVGTQFDVIIREKRSRAQVVPTPFYRRAKRLTIDDLRLTIENPDRP
jgi:aminomethyltransferase